MGGVGFASRNQAGSLLESLAFVSIQPACALMAAHLFLMVSLCARLLTSRDKNDVSIAFNGMLCQLTELRCVPGGETYAKGFKTMAYFRTSSV